jgi:hypothetical protein
VAAPALLFSLPLVGRAASDVCREPGGVTHDDPTPLLADARSDPPHRTSGLPEFRNFVRKSGKPDLRGEG